MGTPTHSTTTEPTKPSKPKTSGYPNTFHKYRTHKTIKIQIPVGTPTHSTSTKPTKPSKPKTSGYPNTLHKYRTHKTIKIQIPVGTPTHSTSTKPTKPSKPKTSGYPQHTPQVQNSQNHQNPNTSGYPNTLHKYKTHKTIKTQNQWVPHTLHKYKTQNQWVPQHTPQVQNPQNQQNPKPVGTPTHSISTELTKPSKSKYQWALHKYRIHKTIKTQNQWVPQHTPQVQNSQNHQNPNTSGYPNTLHNY